MNILSTLLIFIAIALLSLAMNKHYKATFNKPLADDKSKKLKMIGWITLAISLLLVPPSPINYVTWLLELSLIIFAQAWFLTKLQRDRRIKQK